MVPSFGYAQWLVLGYNGTLHDFFRWLELLDACNILYDSSKSGLSAGDIQTALDILARDKELFQKIVFKDSEIPDNPVAGHYPETAAIKNYVDSIISNINEIVGGSSAPGPIGNTGPPGVPGDGFLDVSAFEDNTLLGIKGGQLVAVPFDQFNSFTAGVSGDDVPATFDSSQPYNGLSVNEYADLAPGAWVGSPSQFDGVKSDSKNNGTYFVSED